MGWLGPFLGRTNHPILLTREVHQGFLTKAKAANVSVELLVTEAPSDLRCSYIARLLDDLYKIQEPIRMMVTQTAAAPHHEPILTIEYISDARDVLLQGCRCRHQLERRARFYRISHGSVPLPDTLLGILKVVWVEKWIIGQR